MNLLRALHNRGYLPFDGAAQQGIGSDQHELADFWSCVWHFEPSGWQRFCAPLKCRAVSTRWVNLSIIFQR